MQPLIKKLTLALGVLAVTASCRAHSETLTKSPDVKVDGSSTVYLITKLVATEFEADHSNQVKVSVTASGTGSGFKNFCAGKTDINGASRPISIKEMDACKQAGVAYIELPIAFDAITVAVNPQNTWAKDITVAELKKLWEPEAQGKVTTWKQIRSSWPDRPIVLYARDKNSGTFDYFTQAIGSGDATRTDYTITNTTDDLAQRVISNPNALSYFGLGYYQANVNRLKPLAISNGRSAVLPSRETVQRSTYQPLSRPLFIYVNMRSTQYKPEVKAFVEFSLKNGDRLAQKAGYIPLPAEGYKLAETHFYQGKVGTVFAGTTQPGITITELLKKQALF
jgi:phosphate transport system substrate-binding protein